MDKLILQYNLTLCNTFLVCLKADLSRTVFCSYIRGIRIYVHSAQVVSIEVLFTIL